MHKNPPVMLATLPPGSKGKDIHCPECNRKTMHLSWPDGVLVCVFCGVGLHPCMAGCGLMVSAYVAMCNQCESFERSR